jgi:SPX domain protein involved in polyphosphate accumulation
MDTKQVRPSPPFRSPALSSPESGLAHTSLLFKHAQIFVERKTHREDWTGEKSVKERFVIKEHQLNDYVKGKMTMDEQLEAAAKAKGKDPKDADKVKRLANEVQYAIQTRKLRPGPS